MSYFDFLKIYPDGLTNLQKVFVEQCAKDLGRDSAEELADTFRISNKEECEQIDEQARARKAKS